MLKPKKQMCSFSEFIAESSASQYARAKVTEAALRVISKVGVGTANVSTLNPKELSRSSTRQDLSLTSRASILEEVFFEKALDIVCVQEGRLPDDAVHPSQHYTMSRAGVSPGGHQGAQIWLAQKLAKLVASTRAVKPRILLVFLKIVDVEIMLVSAHAPIEGSEDHGAFWSEVENVLLSFHDPCKLRAIVAGIDSNCPFSTPSGSPRQQCWRV